MTIRYRTYQTAFHNRLWRSSLHGLIDGLPSPLWRQIESILAEFRRGFYPIVRVQQESDRHNAIPLTRIVSLVFARGEFLSVVGSQNESLRIMLMYYMFKY